MPRQSKSTRSTPGLPPTTFVLDNGGHTIKAGFAPLNPTSEIKALSFCHRIPNAIVRTRDKTSVAAQADEITRWDDALFRRPVEHGQVVSWEAQKEIWDLSFFDEKFAKKELFIQNPQETTLMFTEPPNAMPALQKNADEIIMEEWGFGGYTRVVGPSLNAYNDIHSLFETNLPQETLDSLAETPFECLLVVDSGYSHTTVTPLYNGRPLNRAIRRLDFGGKQLTNLLKEVISVRHWDLRQDTKIVNDIKEDICYVSSDFRSDLEETWKGNKRRQTQRSAVDGRDGGNTNPELRVDYTLPDGYSVLRGFSTPHDPSPAARKLRQQQMAATNGPSDASMTLGTERFTIPEIIFSPGDIGSKQPGLADIILQSLSVLPPLIQATMLGNVFLVGGTTRIPGFAQRLEAELRSKVKTEWEVRVRKMEDPVTSTWLGGARMASMFGNVIREYGVTREEYLEHGSAWTARRILNGGAGKGT